MLFEPAVLCACFFLFFCVCSLASRINSVVSQAESRVSGAPAVKGGKEGKEGKEGGEGKEGKEGKGVTFDDAAAAKANAALFQEARNKALRDE